MSPAKAILLPKKAKPFFARHPWIFSGAIAAIEGDPQDGSEIEVYSHGGHFIAHGLYNSKSRIRIRLYSWQHEQSLDRSFFRQQLLAAWHVRRDILRLTGPRRACRLVFSEGDGLSGLTVDQYDRWLVVQFTSLAMAQRRDLFVELLVELLSPDGIYVRTEKGIGQLEGLPLQDGPIWGCEPPPEVVIEEDGLAFAVDIAQGHKTGFYLDQRDNRRAVGPLACGRRVLDAFCYSGGFGLHAARAGAREVIGVDVSEAALKLARRNAQLNHLSQLTYHQADVFTWMEQAVRSGERFGMVILDPPKFARRQEGVTDALRGYRRLLSLALLLLDSDGILVLCCCSALVTMDMLDELLVQTGMKHRRIIQVLERRGQAPDHPVWVSCPESNYLKCLIARVL
ncbi:MAG: class I SAM-dependent rRNA methyltransferase [Gemmataceae bacterium]